MIENIIIGIVISLFKVIGLPLQAMAIAYFHLKPPMAKTAFDLIVIDTIIAYIFAFLTSFVAFIVFCANENITYEVVLTFSIVIHLSYHFAFLSVWTLFSVKFLFLKFGQILVEINETRIRQLTWLVKIALLILFVLIDNFGPVQTDPMPFIALDKKGQFTNQSHLKEGIGFLINLLVMFGLMIFVQYKAREMDPENQENQTSIKITGGIGILAIVFALVIVITSKLTNFPFHSFIMYFFPIFDFCVDIVIPLVIILRHQGLRTFFKRIVDFNENVYDINV